MFIKIKCQTHSNILLSPSESHRRQALRMRSVRQSLWAVEQPQAPRQNRPSQTTRVIFRYTKTERTNGSPRNNRFNFRLRTNNVGNFPITHSTLLDIFLLFHLLLFRLRAFILYLTFMPGLKWVLLILLTRLVFLCCRLLQRT